MTTLVPFEQRIVDCEQGSADWFTARAGCATSSRIADIVAKRKRVKEGEVGEELACRRGMRFECMCELLTGKAAEHYVSRWMQEGHDKEPLARAEYEIAFDQSVRTVGFVYHPFIPRAGCSPDGLIGDDGLLEIKCPMVYTHLDYIMRDEIPEEYKPQMLWQMACCERRWCDFVSYSPELPEQYQLFVKRFECSKEDAAMIRGYELEVQLFNTQVDEMLEQLKARNHDFSAARG
jgi:YqaJ-like viral recombinase domain